MRSTNVRWRSSFSFHSSLLIRLSFPPVHGEEWTMNNGTMNGGTMSGWTMNGETIIRKRGTMNGKVSGRSRMLVERRANNGRTQKERVRVKNDIFAVIWIP